MAKQAQKLQRWKYERQIQQCQPKICSQFIFGWAVFFGSLSLFKNRILVGFDWPWEPKCQNCIQSPWRRICWLILLATAAQGIMAKHFQRQGFVTFYNKWNSYILRYFFSYFIFFVQALGFNCIAKAYWIKNIYLIPIRKAGRNIRRWSILFL